MTVRPASWNALRELALARGADEGEAEVWADAQLGDQELERVQDDSAYLLWHRRQLRAFEDGDALVSWARRLWVEGELELPCGTLTDDEDSP
jgi:hypothetical protein